MPFMTWSPALELPHDGINEQHKALVAAVNAFAVATQTPDEVDPMETLIFLTRYADEHFRDEEALMRATGYPEFERHHAMHEALFQEVESRVQGYVVNGECETLLDFLKDWLTGHIGGADLAFARYVAASQHPQG